MDLAQETKENLHMAMQETTIDTLSLMEGREKIMDTQSLPIHSQTLVQEEDKDQLKETLHTPLDNQTLLIERILLGKKLTHSIGTQNQAEEEDKKTTRGNQEMDSHIQKLDIENNIPG